MDTPFSYNALDMKTLTANGLQTEPERKIQKRRDNEKYECENTVKIADILGPQ
jgi:hypothetical protein